MRFFKDDRLLIIIALLFFLSNLLIHLYYFSGDLIIANLGGDVCHHINIVKNIYQTNIPNTDFIYSNWFNHNRIPAMTDIYPPGVHYLFGFASKIIGFNYLNLRIMNIILALINFYLMYLVTKQISSNRAGIISTILMSFNFFLYPKYNNF